MASSRDPEPGGGLRPALGAGLSSSALITIAAQLTEDPYKTLLQGAAGIVGPLVMGAWPTIRREMRESYRQRRVKKTIRELRSLIDESEKARSPEEHLTALRLRLRRAESYLADIYIQEALFEEEEEEPIRR